MELLKTKKQRRAYPKSSSGLTGGSVRLADSRGSGNDTLEAKDKKYVWHPFTQMQDWEKEEIAIIEELVKAYNIRQDHYPSLVNLSSVYLDLGQPEKAREIALHGLQIRPDGKEIRQVLDAAEAQLRRRG